MVSAEVYASAGLGENNMRLELNNLNSTSLSIVVEAGTLFTAEDSELQNMLIAKPLVIKLAPSSKEVINITAFCTEVQDYCPSEGDVYYIDHTKDRQLIKLIEFIAQNPKAYSNRSVLQSAIWSVTDENNVSTIYEEGSQETEELRSYVCILTGQEDVWYNVIQDITVNEQGRIVSEPLEVNGEINIHNPKEVAIRSFLVNQRGEIVWEYPDKILLPAGNIEYWFKLKVENWERGNYTIYYASKTDTLLAQEFSL